MTATVRGVSTDGRGGTFRKTEREYTVTYYVTTDDIDDGPNEVHVASGIPLIGDYYMLGNEFDSNAIVTDKRVSQRESPWEWEVEVIYSTLPSVAPGGPDTVDEDPVLQPPEITFGFEARTIVVPGSYNLPSAPDRDRGRELGIVSSNGELFDPQPEMEVCDPVITVKKNLKDVLAIWLMEIADTVNVDEFYGAAPRTFRLKPPLAHRLWHQKYGFYWSCTFEFVYRWDTWDLQILNRGSFYVDESPGGNMLIPFQDDKGRPFKGLLAADGDPLNYDDPDRTKWGRFVEGGEDVSYTRLQVYRSFDFNVLGIL